MSEFQKRLNEYLISKRWTQAKLAEESGLTPVTINRYVNGSRTPRLDHLISIADALCVSIDWLCGREEWL